jgi:hypothetical protein
MGQHQMTHFFRMLAFTVAIIAPITSCAAAEPRVERLSQAQIDALLESADIPDPWEVAQERDSGDEHIPWVVFVTQRPRPLSDDVCVAREVVMRLSVDGRTIIERNDSSSVAFRPCANATTDDFRSVDGDIGFDLNNVPLLARLLRETKACSPSGCVERGSVQYEIETLRGACEKADIADLSDMTADSPRRLRFVFSSKTVGPEMLGCEFRKDASGVWNLRVYRELGPERVYTN